MLSFGGSFALYSGLGSTYSVWFDMCRWVFLAPVCSRLWRSDVATAPICFRWTCVACFCLPPISFIILVTPSFPRLIPITFWYTIFTKIVICLADLLTLLIYLIFYMNPATWEINSEYYTCFRIKRYQWIQAQTFWWIIKQATWMTLLLDQEAE